MRNTLLMVAFCCSIGQLLFTLGLQFQIYALLLYGRLVFGFSDCVTVFQQTILCYWFDAKSLPMVFGIMLFLLKSIRAINDNIAPIFFNTFQALSPYFWIGFVISLASLISIYYLIEIHELIFDPSMKQEVEEDPEQKGKRSWNIFKGLPLEYYQICFICFLGYASIYSFYPNMSSFFQLRFGFTNQQAGLISSIPYIIASFATPVFGHFIQKMGETYFEILMTLALGSIFVTHMLYSMTPDYVFFSGPKVLSVLPILIFGLGHALLVTVQGPIINKVVKNKSSLANAFAIMKIFENAGQVILLIVAGYLRQKTGNFTAVCILFMILSLLGTVVTFRFHQLMNSPKLEEGELEKAESDPKKNDDKDLKDETAVEMETLHMLKKEQNSPEPHDEEKDIEEEKKEEDENMEK